VQIATTERIYILDGVKLGAQTVCEFLRPMLQDGAIVKIFHDLRMDAAAFSRFGDIQTFRGTFDTQLACESKTGVDQMGYNGMLQLFGQPTHPTKNSMSRRLRGGDSFLKKRPLTPNILAYAADEVKLLVAVHECIYKSLGEEKWLSIQSASDERAQNVASKVQKKKQQEQMRFDAANGCALASFELLNVLCPQDILFTTPLQVFLITHLL
jgi:ribonuclease D